MCGFVLFYSPTEFKFDPELLENMTNQLIHRGPDDYGYAFIGPEKQVIWHDASPSVIYSRGVAMGHRRLSILDLSVAGRQPFYSPDKRYWMVYNGEVYNYCELRDELKGLGHHFYTSTDTEVVLVAFKQWGKGCLNRFNGMWAFVIWDTKTETLFVSRDRFGIKPLYYFRMDNKWFFASEIKALFKHPSIIAKANKAHIFRYLWSVQRPENAETFFKDIYSVPPASFLEIKTETVAMHRYWSLPEYSNTLKVSHEDKCRQFVDLLRDSVRLRLRSDVKVGTMLSGGLDSTSISCMINELLSNQGNKITSIPDMQQAFSASYPNLWNDETEKVDELGRALHINVEKVYPINEDVKRIFKNVINAIEEPFGGNMPQVQYMLMHRAKAKGIKVTLNGHGPDEMLAGYPLRHCALVAIEYLNKLLLGKFYSEYINMKSLHGINLQDLIYSFFFNFSPASGNLMRNILRNSKRKYFNKKLFTQYHPDSFRSLDKTTGGRTVLDRRLRREFFTEIVPPTLQIEDRISMSASIESRVPFLDYRIVEFAFGLSDSDRINKGVTKYLLRNAMKDYLPPSIRNDNKKLFFNGDILTWMQNGLKSTINDLLMDGESNICEFMNPLQFRPLISSVFNKGSFDNWDEELVWRMLVTEIWMRSFFN
jgi:asparagine synthase (glutamine-hydrolysing)